MCCCWFCFHLYIDLFFVCLDLYEQCKDLYNDVSNVKIYIMMLVYLADYQFCVSRTLGIAHTLQPGFFFFFAW